MRCHQETVSKTDDFNAHLMKVTCELMEELLPRLRERKLLNLQFLSVLPNKEDELTHVSNRLQLILNSEEKPRGFYSPLHNVIVKEFKNQKLTPTKRKDSYAPAKDLCRGTREMSEVIRDDDLATLLGKDRHLPLWVKNLPSRVRDDRGRFVEDENAKKQNERINDFLDTLDILEWGVEDLIEALNSGAEPIMKWLQNKGDEWYQKFYAFLDDAPSYYEDELSELCIVRCIDGEYRIGTECHFFSDDVKPNEGFLAFSTVIDDIDQAESQEEETQEVKFHYVDPAVYSFGNNKNHQEKAQNFLKTIKVTEVDDTERVKAILKQWYKDPFNPRDEDMKKFIALVKENPASKSIFDNYFIFEIDLERDNKRWYQKPNKIFVDSPYLDTGLTVYYNAISEDSDSFKRALSPNYAKSGSNIAPEDLAAFAEAVGVQTKLKVIKQKLIPCDHPEYDYLVTSAPGQYRHNTSVREDYTISELSCLLSMPLRHKKQDNIDKALDTAKLIWRTMCLQSHDCLIARYRNNRRYPIRVGSSSLVHALINAKWVPQKDDGTISFVRPCNASIERLPSGFPYETEQKWLEAIEFGQKTKEQQEEHAQRNQQAKNFGFDSSEKAEKYAKLDQILEKRGISADDLLSQYSSQNSETTPDFPTSQVRNPELQEKRYLIQIRNRPHKIREERTRNERVTKDEIDQRDTLQRWYTNDSDEMICQICKEEMPFKKLNGDYYFIALEALTIRFKNDELPENHFSNEDEAQYLALCPECAARYKYFVREVKEGEKVMEELRNHLINSEDMEFPLELGELKTSIKFVETHFMRLKWALRHYENPDEVEDSTD